MDETLYQDPLQQAQVNYGSIMYFNNMQFADDEHLSDYVRTQM